MKQGKPIYMSPGVLHNVRELQKDHFCLTLVSTREIIQLCTHYALSHRDDFELFLNKIADELYKE